MVAIVVVVQIVRGDEGPGLWFVAAFVAAAGWNAYWWLFRIATEVSVDGGTLSWRTPLRRGSAPVSSVTAVGRSRMTQQLAKIELASGRPVLVQVRVGFAALVDAIRDGAPNADVQGA